MPAPAFASRRLSPPLFDTDFLVVLAWLTLAAGFVVLLCLGVIDVSVPPDATGIAMVR